MTVQEGLHPVIMTVATSDSGGGAGIQADLKTMTALGGFATSVLVALTAQNGAEVRGIHALPADFIALQYAAVVEGFPVRAAKTGMLYSSRIMDQLAGLMKTKDFPLVVDPVSVSQSGFRLLREDAQDTLVRRILPLADLLTPNRYEAELLAGMSIRTEEEVREAGRRLLEMGAGAVLIKGGHFEEFEGTERIADWLCQPGDVLTPLYHGRVETTNNHGTGCILSAAIATFMGQGLALKDSIIQAQAYLVAALQSGYAPGIGAGSPDFTARWG